jgi:hypothetical protein
MDTSRRLATHIPRRLKQSLVAANHAPKERPMTHENLAFSRRLSVGIDIGLSSVRPRQRSKLFMLTAVFEIDSPLTESPCYCVPGWEGRKESQGLSASESLVGYCITKSPARGETPALPRFPFALPGLFIAPLRTRDSLRCPVTTIEFRIIL